MSVTTKVLLGLVVMLFFPGLAFATSYSPTAADIEVQPGDSSAVTFQIFHDQPDAKDYFVQLMSARVGDGPDDVLFSEISPDVASWMTLSDAAFTLSSGQVKELTVSVDVPADAASQVQVIAVQIIERANARDMIGASTGVSPFVFLSVGDLPASAELVAFSASRNVTDALPVSFLIELKNTGLRVLQPEGTIVLENMFGETIDILPINEGERRVTSDVTRAFTTEWGEASAASNFFDQLTHEITHFTIGWVKAKLYLAPWEGAQELEKEVTVFFFPWRTVLVLCAVITLLLGLLRASKR